MRNTARPPPFLSPPFILPLFQISALAGEDGGREEEEEEEEEAAFIPPGTKFCIGELERRRGGESKLDRKEVTKEPTESEFLSPAQNGERVVSCWTKVNVPKYSLTLYQVVERFLL